MEESPDDKAQSNFTDPELHIMRTNNKGWDYCGNAQASVDGACQIILACDVTAASNDKQTEHIRERPANAVNTQFSERNLLRKVKSIEVHREEVYDRRQKYPLAELEQVRLALR